MEKILAKRYAFCDFSDISGFPHPVPTINEWDDYLPRFRGSKYDHPGEHLFNFHQCMLEHGFVHEDVLIKLFKFSLEGNAREWCQSLPAVSIHSLKDFHVAFNSYYEKIYSADLLFLECCHEDKIVPIESLKSEEQIFISASDIFRSTEIEEDSLQFPDLQGLSNLQLEHVNHDPGCVDVIAAYVEDSLHLPDLQNKTDLEQPAFNNELIKGSFQHLFNLQLDQQSKKVLLCDFDDPFADYLESMSSIDLKIFLPEEDCLYPLFKHLFYMIWLPLLFESRSKMPVNHNLTWLHWKSSVT